jgi:hypothetical protein
MNDKFGIVEKLIAEGKSCNGKYLGGNGMCQYPCICPIQADYYNFCYKKTFVGEADEWDKAYHKKGVEIYQKIKKDLDELEKELTEIEKRNDSIDKFFKGEK